MVCCTGPGRACVSGGGSIFWTKREAKSMTEHERKAAGSTRRDGSTDPDERQLRALCESADIRLTPSAALHERMAELAARHDAATAQRHRPRPFGRPGWQLASSAVAATLCAALLGGALIQWDHSRRQRL